MFGLGQGDTGIPGIGQHWPFFKKELCTNLRSVWLDASRLCTAHLHQQLGECHDAGADV